MKAQIATEYLFVLGIILVILIPILYYATSESTNAINLNDAQDTAQTLAKTADYVYSLGPGTSNKIIVNMPPGIKNVTISGKEITLKTSKYGDVIGVSKANLTGNISSFQGIHEVIVKCLDTGIVSITQ
ncbi:MAG: hypothetical protein AABW56_05030 [Nanoarchaeota archaeon]